MDCWVRYGLKVGCCGVLRVESEEFEGGAGGGVVDYVESGGWRVVGYAEGVEVYLGGGEGVEVQGLRGEGGSGEVVEVEGSLVLWIFEDALLSFLVDLYVRDE